MSDQLTQCPHCQTSFRVTSGQLKAAGGLVRCGACLGLFSAAINFIRVKPDHAAAAGEDVEAAGGFASSDDILLGDLDLDSLPVMEQDTDDDYDLALAEDDALSAAGDILLSDPVAPRREQPEEYELYEEYEEPPDLLANLALQAATHDSADAATAEPFTLVPDGDAAEPAAASAHAPAQDADEEGDTDWLDGPSEEFNPRTMLFDDDDVDDEPEPDEFDADDAAEDTAGTFAQSEAGYRDASAAVTAAGATGLERDEPVLGEMDADELFADEFAADESDIDDFAGAEAPDEPDDGDGDDDYLAPGEAHADAGYAMRDDDPDDHSAEEDADAILEEYMEEIRVEARDSGTAGDDVYTLAASAPRKQPGTAKPDWMQRRDPLPPEKAALHDYLATLEDEDELEPLDTATLDELDDEPVLLAAGRRKRGLLATLGLSLLSLLLIGTLVLQFVDQHLDALRQRNSFARFEPWFCRILECPPPAAPVTASSSLYSQELLIRSHPRLRGALELSFIFRNDADEAQPFPGLELAFKDPSDRLLANRLLLPAEYLPAELRPLAAMPAHSSVQVMLELVDPGAEAVNYTITFRDL